MKFDNFNPKDKNDFNKKAWYSMTVVDENDNEKTEIVMAQIISLGGWYILVYYLY